MHGSEDRTVCCANCQHMYLPKRSDYSNGGCKSTWVEGYICLAFGDEGIATWMIGNNEHTAFCECFCERKHKVQILSRSVGEERAGSDRDGQDEEDLFELVRRNYATANKEYLQRQIRIASEYLTEEQKGWLREHGYQV